MSIFSENQSTYGDLTILWVYVAFVVFGVGLNILLFLVFTGVACTKGDEGERVCVCICLHWLSCTACTHGVELLSLMMTVIKTWLFWLVFGLICFVCVHIVGIY